jgi:hypothetical protein
MQQVADVPFRARRRAMQLVIAELPHGLDEEVPGPAVQLVELWHHDPPSGSMATADAGSAVSFAAE